MTEARPLGPRQPGKRSAFACGFAIFALLVLALLKRITDFDIWFDLVLGREVLQTLRIPRHEFYLYSLLGQTTTWPEWGFGALYYMVRVQFGLWGMSVLNAATTAATLLAFYSAAVVGRRRGPAAIALLCGLLWLIDHRAVYRPEMALYLALGCAVYLLELHLIDGRRRPLAFLPLVGAVLANFHPSVIFLLVVIGCYGVQCAVDALRQRGPAGIPRAVMPLALALGATALGSLLNPYGMHQILLPFKYVQSTDLLGSIAEYRPTLTTTYRWHVVAIAALAFWATVVRRPRRPVDLLLLVLFGYLGFRYVRNVTLFGLMVYVPVVRAAEASLRGVCEVAGRRAVAVAWSVAGAICVATLAAFVSRPEWGAGIDPVRVPDRAAEVIATVRPPGRIFNYYDTGGYLAWKLYDDYRVFIDGRRYTNDLANSTHGAVFFEGEDWERVLESYGATMVVTRATATVTGRLIPLVAFLDGHEKWALASVEPWYYLFVRRDAIEGLDGVALVAKNRIWPMVILEADAIMAAYPRSSTPALLTKGFACFRTGRVHEAAALIADYVRRRPRDREAARLAADLEAAIGGDAAARARVEALHQAGRGNRPPIRW